MVVYSAPAKIYLFGEHAVVYGKHAVAVAVDLRTRVELFERSDSSIYHTAADTRYIKEAVKVFSAIKDVKGVEIDVKSDIPIGAGLGSSAAVTVATLGALNDEFDGDLNKTKIANLAFKVEKSVQGVASPTDTFVSTVGGIVLVPDLIRILDTIEPAIVIGDTRTVGSTKELVEAVGELRSREPEVVDLIFDAIDTISTLGYSHLKLGDYARVGEFMNINHGLLDALGVGSLKLSTLVDVARSNGALGAKITGAGGGGCIVTICERDRVEAVCDAIKAHGGDAIVVDVANDGLRREE
ncbi:MAG: mevalonate kinase [Candidatus Syntropharchaeales archaeon]